MNKFITSFKEFIISALASLTVETFSPETDYFGIKSAGEWPRTTQISLLIALFLSKH